VSFNVGFEIMYAKWFWKCASFLKIKSLQVGDKTTFVSVLYYYSCGVTYKILNVFCYEAKRKAAFWVLRIWCCSEGTGTPAACLGGLRFRCWLLWGFFVTFVIPFKQVLGQCIKLGHMITSLPLSALDFVAYSIFKWGVVYFYEGVIR